MKLYTVWKNTAGFVRFYKWTLVLSNLDYKRYIYKIINGGSEGEAPEPPFIRGEAPRNLRKF